MNNILKRFGLVGILLSLVLFGGCILSATFVIEEMFTLSVMGNFYFYQVDITEDDDWDEHKDNIDLIDAVGFEIYYTSSESGDVTFDAYVAAHSGAGSDPSEVPASALQIIDDFTIAPGTGKMTYGQSLGAIENLDSLKVFGKLGMFDFYLTSTGTVGSSFVVDSARVIMTITASE